MTFGLDTTVVLRLLLGEPVAQASVARSRLEAAVLAGDTVIVSDLVVAEAYHALHYHYGVKKEDARELLRNMVTSGTVTLEPEEALSALSPGRGAGVVDRLIAARYDASGASTWTFDRKLGALRGVDRL